MTTDRVVLGISGASGAAIAVSIAEQLGKIPSVELHLVVSDAAARTLRHEVGEDALPYLQSLSAHVYAAGDIGATIASGSFHVRGMIIAPCSMRTLAAVACGLCDTLLTRAADVHLSRGGGWCWWRARRPCILATCAT